MRPAQLAILPALGAAAFTLASCSAGAHLPPVAPEVQSALFDCGTQRAAGYGFVIVRVYNDEPGVVRMIRVTNETNTNAAVDGLVLTVGRADSASAPQLFVRAFAAEGWGGAGTQELPPSTDLKNIAGEIVRRCRGGGRH